LAFFGHLSKGYASIRETESWLKDMPDAAPKQRSRITLRDVAKRAGVSMMTVSRVLNGHPDVAPDTRDAVLQHAQDLGYGVRPSPPQARGRTGLIALAVPFMPSEGDFFAEIVAGASEALAERGAYLVLCSTRYQHDREVSLVDLLQRGRTDGAILISPAESPAELEALCGEGHPFVVIDPNVPLGDEIPVIAAMNTAGARAATEHLIGLEHQRIGIMTGSLQWTESIDRLAGYHAALAAAGLPVLPDLLAEADFTIHGGQEAAERLLALPDPPTAIFACNDNMAIGVIQAAVARGLAVPRDLSVVGFDDVAAAALITPPLTTVRQPLQDMGRAAVGLLYRLIDGQPVEAMRTEVATRLIVRASTGAPVSPDV
jgi:LacI family transcriptional regulator